MIINYDCGYDVSVGDVITVNEKDNFPIGIAMNDANKGESVNVLCCGSIVISPETYKRYIKSTSDKFKYEVPIINMEVRKIELDR